MTKKSLQGTISDHLRAEKFDHDMGEIEYCVFVAELESAVAKYELRLATMALEVEREKRLGIESDNRTNKAA